MRIERAIVVRKYRRMFNMDFTLSSVDLDFQNYFLQCFPLENNILKHRNDIRNFVLVEEIYKLNYSSALTMWRI